jgi:hypothetical protein
MAELEKRKGRDFERVAGVKTSEWTIEKRAPGYPTTIMSTGRLQN